MNDEDFLFIEDFLRDQCRDLGVPEIMEDRFYQYRENEDEPERLLPTQKRVIAQLEALDRFLSLFDRDVYEGSMQAIQVLLLQAPTAIGSVERVPELPQTAVVLVPDRTGAGEEEFNLGELPRLGDLRSQLARLTDQLRGL